VPSGNIDENGRAPREQKEHSLRHRHLPLPSPNISSSEIITIPAAMKRTTTTTTTVNGFQILRTPSSGHAGLSAQRTHADALFLMLILPRYFEAGHPNRDSGRGRLSLRLSRTWLLRSPETLSNSIHGGGGAARSIQRRRTSDRSMQGTARSTERGKKDGAGSA